MTNAAWRAERPSEAGWTRNVPANEGEYWFRSDGVRKPIVAHVYLDVEQDLRIIIGINDIYVTDMDGFDEFDGAEFLGPLTPDSYQQGRVAGLQEAGDLHEQVNTYCDHEPKAGAGGMGVAIRYRDLIRQQATKLAQQAQEGGVGDDLFILP